MSEIIGNGVFVGGKNKQELPSGYTKLSHVSFNGHTYFNTGLFSTSDFGFLIEYSNSSGLQKNLFGGFDMNAENAVFVAVNGSNFSLYTSLGNETVVSGYSSFMRVMALSDASGIQYSLYFSPLTSKQVQFVSGAVIIVGSFGDIINGQISVRDNEFSGKISQLEFYNGNQCVANFAPCKNDQGVVGFYDTVRNMFYSSEGSSQFTEGYEVP